MARGFAGLEAPEDVGRIAAERALRRLGARKVETQKVPVIFEPRTARTLLGNIFDAVHGDVDLPPCVVPRRQAGREGRRPRTLTVIDDGTIPGLFGTSPFDDEGVPSRRTVVIERGVLKSYLLNTYTARKLGLKTTGNASRGLTGNAGIGHGNFFIEAGRHARRKQIHRRHSQRLLRHRTDRLRCQHRDRRLFARRRRLCGSGTANWRFRFPKSPSPEI